MFIGGARYARSGLPGMNLAAGIGMGIGAMCTAMLRLPLTSTLLAVVLMGVDGVAVTPQVVGGCRRRLRDHQCAPGSGSQDAKSCLVSCLFRGLSASGGGVAIGDWLPLLP